jgi:EAL domain-containing protein (putative c-di-GMP-specific phosphodiesterase class I)
LCDPQTGVVTSGEALIRWDHPKRGLINPGAFIELAERNGSIMKLDRYVWESTCRYLRTWIDSGGDPIPISMNVSRIDLYSGDCVDHFIKTMKNDDIDPHLLRIEITESGYMEHISELNDVISRFHSEGFVVMMDDFGSGYSSLGMLRDSPFDQVKLDMKFMKGDADSERSHLVLTSMTHMLHELGTYTIIEGVETQEQVDMSIEAGCDAIQGFFNSRALPFDEFRRFVEERKKRSKIS